MQLRDRKFRNYTIDLNAYEGTDGLQVAKPYAVHWSFTWNRLGSNWGSYDNYKKLLRLKWPKVETT